jgi:membrane protease YdiL (CAAX protease family)
VVRPDYRLITAVIAPLLIWPWLPPWDNDYLKGGAVSAVVLFTLIPIAEEMLFRGFLQGELLARDSFKHITAGLSKANWLTSIAFACAHIWQHPLILIPGYFAVSLVLGYFRERYGGILVPVLLHCYFNLGLLLFAVS